MTWWIWLGPHVPLSVGQDLREILEVYFQIPEVRVVQGDFRPPDSSEVYVLTTPNALPPWLPRLPVRFSHDTLMLQDTFFVASDLLFAAHFRSGSRTFFVGVAPHPEVLHTLSYTPPGTFYVARARDGMNPWERWVRGKLQTNDTVVRIDTFQVLAPPGPNRMDSTAVGRVRLFFAPDFLRAEEARHLARTLQAMFQSVGDPPYRFPLPESVRVYVYPLPPGKRRHPTTYSEPSGWIWFRVKDRKDLLTSCRYLLTLAHEVARITFQPVVEDSAKRTGFTPTGDDWSHVGPILVTLPYLAAHLKNPWFVRCDLGALGPKRFDTWYRGAHRTYAWIMARWIREGHADALAQVIRKHLKKRRHPDLVAIMEEAAEKIGGEEPKRVEEAFTTPLEHSLRYTGRWGDPGFRPSLEIMAQTHRFVIEKVLPGSPAWKAGFRPGDRIVAMEGWDLETHKAEAWRAALAARDTLHFLVERDRRTVSITLHRNRATAP